MPSKTVKMKFNKSTPGTHVYASDDVDMPVTTVYVKRAALPTTPPPTIEFTLEWNE